MHYIVLDLEATCWDGKNQAPNETIEIGALCINQKGEILDEFVSFIKPSLSPILSAFCTELTTITQEQVDNASFFPVAIASFQQWILSFGQEYCLCSWGFYDKKQFQNDCVLHGIATDWLKNHISIKHQYAEIKNLKRKVGMAAALREEKMDLNGTHHRGIDDARNITKIFLKYLDNWDFSILDE